MIKRRLSKLLSRAVDALLLLAACVGFSAVILFFISPSNLWWREFCLTLRVRPIQTALESHRQRHGVYPESLETAAIPHSGEIHYQRDADGSYTLWFGMRLGEPVTLRPGR